MFTRLYNKFRVYFFNNVVIKDAFGTLLFYEKGKLVKEVYPSGAVKHIKSHRRYEIVFKCGTVYYYIDDNLYWMNYPPFKEPTISSESIKRLSDKFTNKYGI